MQSEAAAVACKLPDLTCEKSPLTDANTFSHFYLTYTWVVLYC